MTEPGPITVAFLSSHPQDAARVMEQLDPADVAAFLAGVPVRLAAPALAVVAPWRAGRCLAELPAERAAALVDEMPSDRRALCLRTLRADTREAILECMPRRRARALQRQLRYPAALVGAVMVGETVTVPVAATVGDARRALRTAADSAALQLYLVDDGRPVAILPLARLLTADPKRPVRDLAQWEPRAIPADTPLSQVRTDLDWNGHPERPVVDSRHRLVGAVTLERVLATRDRPVSAVSRGPGPGVVLGRSYLVGVTGLLRVAGAILAGGRGPDHGR